MSLFFIPPVMQNINNNKNIKTYLKHIKKYIHIITSLTINVK